MSTSYNLDHYEELRRADELKHVKRLLAECNNDRKVLRPKLDDMRIANWKVAFGDLDKIHAIEVVTWEEGIQTKGYTVNRSQSIASGHYGEIYTATHKSEPSKLYTCKVLMYKKFAEMYKIADMRRQAKLLDTIAHPKIMQLVKIYEVSNTNKWYLFTQVATLGSVEQTMQENRGHFSVDITKGIARDVAQALSYLHYVGIAHRKVRPKNIFLNSLTGQAKLSVPMCAFEITNATGETVRCRAPGIIDDFMAPEAIYGVKYDPLPVDVWAYGCTVYYMLISRSPFDRVDDRDHLKKQIDEKSWKKCGGNDKSPKLQVGASVFIETIIHGAIQKRPCMAEILASPWIS